MAGSRGEVPEPGAIIAGKYRVRHVIGSGGMGCVVAAEHVSLRQLVAVKFIRRLDASEMAEATGRFAREAQAAAAIQSEHVARVLDVGTLEDGAPYMVMEHLVGTDLRELQRMRGVLPVPEAVDYLLQVCEAMAEAHGLGIIHRDLKPANVFLANRVDGVPVVKVLDFGIAKSAVVGKSGSEGLTATDVVMGSVRYMSPEQIRGLRNADARSDIWSLGVILYELVTGARPFEGESLPDAMMRIAADPPRPIPAGTLHPTFAAAIMRCLEKDPRARPQTIAELAQSLAPFGPPDAPASIARIHRSLAAASQRVPGTFPGPAAPAIGASAPVAETQGALGRTTGLPAPRTASRLWIAGGLALSIAAGALTAILLWPRLRGSAPPRPVEVAADMTPSKIDAERLASFAPLPKAVLPASPTAAARIALGEKLFADPRVSKNSDVACTTCHVLSKFGTDGMKHSRGTDGLEPGRNTLGIYNMAGYFALLWDGRKDDLTEQAKEVLQLPKTMAATPAVLESKLRAVPEYPPAFVAAFPGERAPLTFDNIARALAAYEETLTSPGRWDRFLEGDAAAITDDEKAGFNRFVDVGCPTCHFGPHVGATMFQKTGLVKAWPDTKDRGKYELTKRDSDYMVFRVPSLRNVAATAPYFHDGSIATLDTAIRMMALHQLGKELDDRDVSLIQAWLGTLTGSATPPAPAASGAPTSPPH